MTWLSLFQTTFIFFMILDPLANVPLFIASLKNFNSKRQQQIIIREMIIALAVMLLFFFFGQAVLHSLNIEAYTLNIAGGIILFLIAIRMVFSSPITDNHNHTAICREPLIVPLAVPAVAGPAILATISLYVVKTSSKLEVFIAIILAWVFSLPILLSSSFLRSLLKDNGLIAVERLMGFIIILLAVDMFLKGLLQGFHLST